MPTFYRLDGVIEAERFMQAPPLKSGCVWMEGNRPGHYTEVTSPHGPESDPNHHHYSNKIFGYDENEFLARQYKK